MTARRILFFADASSIHTRRWVGEMAQRGFDCVLATRRPAEVPGASEVITLRAGADAAGWFAALPAVRRLAERLRPRWLHGHYVTSYGLWAASAARVVDAPLVLTAWGSDILVTPRQKTLQGRLAAALVQRSLRRAALVTADSRDMLDEIRRYGIDARCEEVLWGADTERFVPGAPGASEASDAMGRGFGVVSLRAWEDNYQIPTLLRAFAALREARPQAGAQLHLLGGGPQAEALRRLAGELGLADTVAFTGRVDDAAMIRTLQQARVSVSVPRSDATSVSLLESMACGLPVVASDLPANRQWLDADWLVPAGDAAALSERLLRLHDDPAAAAAAGRRNRELALRKASRRAQMDRMAALYESLQLRAAA